MLRGHVFVVNEDTLPIHLEYMFVGVGAGDKDKHIGLLCDMYRVKKDDLVFFYIEGKGNKKGRFLGIFRAVDNNVYHLTGNEAKTPNLPKKLIYRKKIKPYKVFQNGVLEWMVLDKLPTYSKELLWTLIYRKMKGQRGNTMLFPWETERLISLIEDENKGKYLEGNHFNFDKESYSISEKDPTINGELEEKNGKSEEKIKKNINKGESYFQAFILQNLSINNNEFYPEIFGKNIVWIGNEVFAGSGMQKIDLLTIEKIDETSYLYRIIELKHYKSKENLENAVNQLEYYVNWAREDIGGHLIGSRKYNIKPVIVLYTDEFNKYLSETFIKNVGNLSKISCKPEIYEINKNLELNKLL